MLALLGHFIFVGGGVTYYYVLDVSASQNLFHPSHILSGTRGTKVVILPPLNPSGMLVLVVLYIGCIVCLLCISFL